MCVRVYGERGEREGGREGEREGRGGEREGETEYGNRMGRGRMGVLNWYASCTFLMKHYIDIHVHT